MGKIIIAGAGLSGSLLAVRLAQQGFEVSLHERRGDLRSEVVDGGRSINLALSDRGLQALDTAGIRDQVIPACIPMHGRYVHPHGAAPFLASYSGRQSECINSVSRGGLNAILLNKAEEYPNLSLHFNSICESVDLKAATARFINEKTGERTEVHGDIVVGADGAGSAVRRSMMSISNELRFSYSQSFLEHGYKEMSIPPKEGGGFRIEKNALHIWPRGSYMIIALPNLDGSFTVTMFHPYEGENGFNDLDSPEKVKAFFEKWYPELIEFMPNYLEEFFGNPTSSLATIRCFPWQAYGKAVLIGDAAHAVVPFYGQGMNASFEDVRVFMEILERKGPQWTEVLKEFENARAANANAIADLAIENFYEMRDKVKDPVFIKKRNLEVKLEQTIPEYYSKYALVTFRPDIPYAEAMRRGRLQDEVLMKICAENEVKNLDLLWVHQQVKNL